MGKEGEAQPLPFDIDRRTQRLMLIAETDIPQTQTIARVLDTALAVQFDLSPNYSFEGGIMGIHLGEVIDLSNILGRDKIGLWNENARYIQATALGEIWDFYEKMLRDLFSGHHGDILGIHGLKNPEQISLALLEVLECSGGQGFTQRVLKESDRLLPLKELLDLIRRERHLE